MPKRITLIPGDGIGPEVTAAAVQLLEAAGADPVICAVNGAAPGILPAYGALLIEE